MKRNITERRMTVNIPAPKRYAKALMIHFILFSLFLPGFWAEYWNAYYQDYFAANLISTLIAINIFLHWKIDFKQNPLPAALLSVGVILYNAASFRMYSANPDRFFWKKDHLNVTLAFLFFIALLLAKDIRQIITDKVLRWTIRAFVATNLMALILRLSGYSHMQIMCFNFWKVPYDETNNFLGWFCQDPSEYAFLLLLSMGFFIVYKELFINKWTYLLSQLLLLICLILTNSTTFLLAAGILFGLQGIHTLIQKYSIPQKYVWISFPFTILVGAAVFAYLFNHVETFIQQSLILKGNWRMLMDDPMGLGTTFGVVTYYVDGIPTSIFQAHNVFLNHMLRHSLTVGMIYTILFVIIILCAIIRKPTYQSLGIWAALLIPLNMNYGLQTLHLPFTFYLLYCIFFRPQKEADGAAPAKESDAAVPVKEVPKAPQKRNALPVFEILDLDEEN